jgi:hypothetical protein
MGGQGSPWGLKIYDYEKHYQAHFAGGGIG